MSGCCIDLDAFLNQDFAQQHMLCVQPYALKRDTKVYFWEDVIELLVHTTHLSFEIRDQYQNPLLSNQITSDVQSDLF